MSLSKRIEGDWATNFCKLTKTRFKGSCWKPFHRPFFIDKRLDTSVTKTLLKGSCWKPFHRPFFIDKRLVTSVTKTLLKGSRWKPFGSVVLANHVYR